MNSTSPSVYFYITHQINMPHFHRSTSRQGTPTQKNEMKSAGTQAYKTKSNPTKPEIPRAPIKCPLDKKGDS